MTDTWTSDDGRVTLINGDSLAVLPKMDADSVDSIVTDGPYGLSFMGKAWDHGVPGVEFWREALRVAKPGAHLLAFGGTRTFHRLAVAIEDAGWEIRDTIMWVYGQGFPKSLNIGCKCHSGIANEKKSKQTPECNVQDLRNAYVSEAVDSCERGGEVLQSILSEQGASVARREQFSSAKVWSKQSGVEGRRNVLAEARKLQTHQACQVSAGVLGNGSEGRIHHGASLVCGADDGSDSFENGSGASQEPRPARQSVGESGTFQRQPNAQKGGMVCQKCGGLVDWQGFGTALKPAWEPIIVARKPIDGTVANNVLKHGCGGLNIDGCRIPTNPNVDDKRLGGDGRWSTKHAAENVYAGGYAGDFVASNALGRWPANLIHDGSDDVVELFPDKTGNHGGAGIFASKSGFGGGVVTESPKDSGSASRFFYCAKASKLDRDEGCDRLAIKACGMMEDDDYDIKTGSGNRRDTQRRNCHPTVKPTALMRYLCRLVTPPNGRVLDIFAGSFSTGKAAVLEGFKFTGIDLCAEYVEIGKARIEHAIKTRVEEMALAPNNACDEQPLLFATEP